METGAITGYIDVAQLTLYLFWLFFFSLVVYLHRESKREGYPTVSHERLPPMNPEGLWGMPKPKVFLLPNGGGERHAPTGGGSDERPVAGVSYDGGAGSPLVPTGDPMVDGLGPAAWAMRSTEPDLATDGRAKIVPLRVAADFNIAAEDDDPRGMPVVAACGTEVGKVTECWVDRAESLVRYLEVEPAGGGSRLLVPVPFSTISGGRVRVVSLFAPHFAKVPRTAHPDQVSLREEDQISGFFGGGHLYGSPERLGPLV